MTEPFRLPLELSEEEVAELRGALMRTGPVTLDLTRRFRLIRRLEDHTGRLMREREAQRHARAGEHGAL